MEHAYWTVICKTPGCNKTLIPKGGYLGPVESSQQLLESWALPGLTEFQCTHCGNKHTYTAADFQARTLPYLLEPDAEI